MRRAPTATAANPAAALHAYTARELELAIRGLERRGSHVHAGVHQARKAMRRARAALSLAVAALGPGAGWIDSELRRLCRSLSDLRDAHVTASVLRHASAHGDESARAVLKRALRSAARQRAALRRDEQQKDRDFAERRARLQVLRAGLEGLPWREVSGEYFAMGLARAAADCSKAQTRAHATGKSSHWHDWRRRIRRSAQQHAALRAIASPLAAPRSDYAKLAAHLGDIQDYTLLLARCERRGSFAKADREALRELFQARLRTLRSHSLLRTARSVGRLTRNAGKVSAPSEARIASGLHLASQSATELRSRRHVRRRRPADLSHPADGMAYSAL